MAKLFTCILTFFTAIILLFLSPISAKTYKGNITVGSSLSATNNSWQLLSWRSPSDDFAFGFHPFPNDDSLFLLAIWYVKIPDTIVWYANEGNPVQQGSTVTLTADAGLVLNDHRGTNLWNASSEWNGTFVISYGFMNDTGNFVLCSHKSVSVWESFQNPTDTLLPAQIMKKGGVLYSRFSENNYTKGRFQLRLKYDGNLVLHTRDLTTNYAYSPYYTSETDQLNNKGYQLIYNESGYMNLVAENGTILIGFITDDNIVSSLYYYQRATLNFYGVWTWYTHPKPLTANNGSEWSMAKSIPDNICTISNGKDGSGVCGYNSICTYDYNRQRPTCSCPSYYSLLDPNDNYGSCKPNFKLQLCDGQDAVKGGYQLLSQQDVDWPYCDYAQLEGCTEEECKSSCLTDCFCAVAIFNAGDPGTCWKKKLPLSHGRQDNSVKRTAWLKVRNDTVDPLTPKVSPVEVKNKVNNVIAVLLGGSVFVNFTLFSAIILGIILYYNKKPQRVTSLKELSNVQCFSYQELEEATNGFSQELGRGAFGVVYKGVTTSGNSQYFVAVKKLDRISNNTDKEFETEVNVIGNTHHKNLVHLVGLCKEEDHRLLVYEYMSNGTLADYLFGDLRPCWVDRAEIAQGIAKGILYLHEECSTQIIHCDIKPQNILLDEYHRARISDFGLAKLLVFNQTQTNTAIRGTKGYVAPEWFRNKPITAKVDVYSFGVLLLEIICCRKSVCMKQIEEEGAILTDQAFDYYHSNRLETLVNDDMEALEDRLRLKRFLKVALWCIQENPSLRPTMRTVTQMLDGLAEVPDPPCPSSYTVTDT